MLRIVQRKCSFCVNRQIFQISKLSTKLSPKEETQESKEKYLREVENLSTIFEKKYEKKPQKPPFVKNLLLGQFDTDLLTFPEAIDKEELKNLDDLTDRIKPVSQEQKSNKAFNLSPDFLETARNLKLFGLQVPRLQGGSEFKLTEVCKINEVLAENNSNISGIMHELGVQMLLRSGNEKQIGKYLPELISGKSICAICLASNEEATAQFSSDKNIWVLNGEKSWIVNGDCADIFLVLAKTEAMNHHGLNESKFTLFLVERTFGGVKSKSLERLGLDQTDLAKVTFDNVRIPTENVLGEVNKAEVEVPKVLNEIRLSAGPICSAITTEALNKFVEHCKDISNRENQIITTDLVYKNTAQMAQSIYAMESLTFLTAALIDQYENQDCEMESSIVKAFSAENCHSSTLKCMSFIGSPAYDPNHWSNVLHRNALSHLMLNEPIETFKIIIALQGLQYAGIALQEEVKIMRNPLYYVGAVMKICFAKRRHRVDDPKLVLGLANYLHPSCTIAAKWLEYCVLRLQFATEYILCEYGSDAVSKHMDLLRLADCIIDIYAMTAVLGRASRSYCIGLRHSSYEMLLANSFCLDAMKRVKANVLTITAGRYATNDENYAVIGKRVIKEGYYPQHPLTKNF